jgi:hypothetical protein
VVWNFRISRKNVRAHFYDARKTYNTKWFLLSSSCLHPITGLGICQGFSTMVR